MSKEYFYPSTASRIKAAAAQGVLLLWGTTHHLWFSPLVEQIDSCNVCATLWATRLVAVYFAALPLVVSLALAYSAGQILKYGQNPAPNSWLFFRRRLYRGTSAKLSAYLLGVAALLVALTPGLIAYRFEFAYLFCVADDCGCNNHVAVAATAQACTVHRPRNEA